MTTQLAEFSPSALLPKSESSPAREVTTLDLLEALTDAEELAENPETRQASLLIKTIVATCHGTGDEELIRLADELSTAPIEGRADAAQALYEALNRLADERAASLT